MHFHRQECFTASAPVRFTERQGAAPLRTRTERDMEGEADSVAECWPLLSMVQPQPPAPGGLAAGQREEPFPGRR